MLLTAQLAIIRTQRQEISIIHMLEHHMQQFFSMKINFICFTFVIFQPTFGFHIYPSPKGIHGHEHFGNTDLIKLTSN